MVWLLGRGWTLLLCHLAGVGRAIVLQLRWWLLLSLLVLGLGLLEQVVGWRIYQYLLPRFSLNLSRFCII